MRYFAISFLCFFMPTILNAQNAYYDAKQLKKLIQPGEITLQSTNEVYDILSRYVPKGTDLTHQAIEDLYNDAIGSPPNPNPFISGNGLIKLPGAPSSAFPVKQLKRLPSIVGGLNVTNFADGLSQFLVDRATEELNVAFFNRFKEFLKENPEAGVLFPTTTAYIGNFSPHEYAAFISTLREGFYEDLENLIYNVDDVFLLPKYAELIDDFPEIIISINCIQLVIDLEEGVHPVEVIANFKDLSVWDDRKQSINDNKKSALRNLHNGFKASHLFSNSVRMIVDTIKIDTVKARNAITIPANTCLMNGDSLPQENINIPYDSLFNYHIRVDVDTFIVTKANKPVIDCDTLRPVISFVNPSDVEKVKAPAWISVQDFRENIIEDEVTFKIFLGLLYQQAKTDSVYFIANEKIKNDTVLKKGDSVYFYRKSTISRGSELKYKNEEGGDNLISANFKKNVLLSDVYAIEGSEIKKGSVLFAADTIYVHRFMADNKSKLILFQSLFLELLRKGETVDEAISEITNKKKANEPLTREDYYKYINSSIDIIEFGFGLTTYIGKDISADEYFKIARNGNDLYKNTYEKNYATAIMNATTIFDLTLALVQEEQEANVARAKIESKNPVLKGKGETGKAQAWQQADSSRKEIKERKDIVPEILRYGTFIANVVEADDPVEVKAAIEAAVLPAGSSTVKKYYFNNFAINAYLGGFVRTNSVSTLEQSWDSRVGFIAPVGITYTPVSLGRGGAFSVFGSLIDVGALAQFRVSNDSTAIKEEITLGNIFSPGAYLVYGLAWDIPLSIGFGGQYGPGLFSVDFDEVNNSATPNLIEPRWRWNIFIAVDIPMINLKKGRR